MAFTAKKESCPKCGGTLMENFFRIEENGCIKVYVRCAKCGSFVARYTVSKYTSDKTYDSLLRILRKTTMESDSRKFAKELEAFSKNVENEFKETLDFVEKSPDKRKIEEILNDKKADF